MGKIDTFDSISVLAGKTIELLKDQRIRQIPQNFTIWFEYLNGCNPDMNNVVNNMIQTHGKFTDTIGKEIYSKFFTYEKESEAIRKTNKLVQKSITGLKGDIDGATNGFTDYEEKLSSFAITANHIGGKELQDTVSDILDATSRVSEEANVLKSSLDNASQKIADLQQKLEVVEKESLTDELTGISNRKSFNERIEQIELEARKNGKNFCLIMMDIDHFKSFNDNHGHQFGDEVLKFVAKTIENCTPKSALAARYGGEEFSVLLPSCTAKKALILAENMRQKISSKILFKRNSGEEVGNITMSFGIAEFNIKESVESCIERADAALYNAKRNGRNRAEVSTMQIASAS